MRGIMFAVLVLVGCDDGPTSVAREPLLAPEADSGTDAGACPPYVPDAGVVRLRRGCPLMVPYSIR